MEFKKTDSKELERTITIVTVLILAFMPVATFLQMIRAVQTERIMLGEVVLTIGSLILLMFDAMYLMQKENRFLTIVDILLLLSAGSIAISTLFAQDVGMAVGGNDAHGESTWVLLTYLLFAFNGAIIKDHKNRKILYTGLIVVAVFQVIMAVLQVIIQPDFLKEELENLFFTSERAYGTIDNPGPFGSYIILFAGLECGLLYHAKTWGKRIFHGVLLVALSYAMILSGTRGAIYAFFLAAFIFSIVVVVVAVKKKEKVLPKLGKLGVVLACVIIGLLLINVNTKSKQTVSELTSRVEEDVHAESVSTLGTSRPRVWKMAWDKYVVVHPIIGEGVGNVCYLLLWGLDSGSTIIQDAHNRYLQYLCTQGIVGLAIYLALCITIIVGAVKRWKKLGFDSVEGQWMLGLMIALTAYMVADFFCIGMYSLAPYFFLLLGILLPRMDTKRLLGKKA